MNKPVSLLCQAADLILFLPEFALEFTDLLSIVMILLLGLLVLLVEGALNLFDDRFHVDLHLLDHLLQGFVLLSDELKFEVLGGCASSSRGSLEHLGQGTTTGSCIRLLGLALRKGIQAEGCVAFLHYVIISVHKLMFELVKAIVEGWPTSFFVVAANELV